MLRVFVTGGSGFVGGAVLDALVDRGDAVRGLARSAAAARAVRNRGAEPVDGDLADPAALRAGMRGVDLIVHCAAKTVGGPAERAGFHAVNVEGTAAVLAAAGSARVPRLVFLSTEQVVLGDQPLVDADESTPYPDSFVGPYASSKAEAERQVLAASTSALSTVVVRPRLVWGPGDRTLLPGLVRAARSGRLRWIDGGRHRTSTTYVRNVAEAVLAAAERGRGGHAYFVTDGPPVVFREFAGALLATQGAPVPDGSVPGWAANALASVTGAGWRALSLSGEPPIDRATVRLLGETCTLRDDKARRELGYEGAVGRAGGLAELRSDRQARAGGRRED